MLVPVGYRKGMAEHPLKAFRDRQQLSPQALADLLGVARPTVIRWENGTRKPDVDKLTDIEAKTGITPGELRPELASVLRAAE
jgi:transcriptional regulator with XRE-family HTH domain